MADIGHPSGDGFVLCNVWRSEADMRSFHDEVPVAQAGRDWPRTRGVLISPVWSFARPWIRSGAAGLFPAWTGPVRNSVTREPGRTLRPRRS